MWVRKILIKGPQNTEMLEKALIQALQPAKNKDSGESRPVLSGTPPDKPDTRMIAQPEDLLLCLNPAEAGAESFKVSVQPYNLPDPMDQKRMVEIRPLEIIEALRVSHSDWTLELGPVTEV